MSEPPKETPIGVIERIKQLEREQIESGELLVTPSVIFHFPYLQSSRFLDSTNKEAINQLDIPRLTVTAAGQAMKDLEIKQQISITTLIPGDEEKWYIIPSLGIGGRVLSKAEIRLYFDPEHPKATEALQTWKARQVAHELSHVARSQANRIGLTLLDAMINEGLATHYEEHWGGQYLATPWGNTLTPEEMAREWEKAKPELQKTDYGHRKWFFGKEGQHPVWTGYSLGSAIVTEYFKRHPEEKMAKVVRKSSEDILKDSRFNPSV